MVRRLISIFCFVALMAGFSSSARAQIVFGSPTAIGTGVTYYYWKISDKSSGDYSFSQLVMPINGFIPVRDNLELLFYAVGSVNDFDAGAQKIGLTGTSDVRLQANQSLANDHLILSLGVNVPSGKNKLDYANDTTMLQILSRNYLRFSMRRFGQGFGANLLIGGAAMLGEFRGGAGILFEYTGDYEPYRGLNDYNPGDFVSFTAGLNRKASNSILYSDVTVTLYTPDKFQGRKTFKQSAEAAFRIGGTYETGEYQGDIRLNYLWRGRNSQYDSDETIEQQFQLFGNEFLAQIDLTRYFGSGWAITPSWEIKLISKNEGVGSNEQGSSHFVGLGATLAKSMSDGLTIGIGSKYFVGSANSGAIELDGIQIYTSATASF